MVTLNAKVFKHHYKKTDGTYNVKIVLYHGTKVYLDTESPFCKISPLESFTTTNPRGIFFFRAPFMTTFGAGQQAIHFICIG
jgi:hypothetical protein